MEIGNDLIASRSGICSNRNVIIGCLRRTVSCRIGRWIYGAPIRCRCVVCGLVSVLHSSLGPKLSLFLGWKVDVSLSKCFSSWEFLSIYLSFCLSLSYLKKILRKCFRPGSGK
jgi:hypothetical protein